MKILLILFVLAATIDISAQTVDCDAVKAELDRAKQRLNDWPQLGRYRDANATLDPPKKGEARVVFMGDSITDLWDDEGFGGFFPGKPYVDRGIGGQTTPQMLVRFQQDVIALRPAAVVILAGTNDISGNTGPMTLEQTGENIRSMAELAKANGIRMILSSVLPVSDTVRRKSGEFIIQTKRRPPEKIRAMNAWLRDFAKANGHIYLDYFSAMVDDKGFVKDGLTFDGLHPNKEGYAIMNPMVEKAIGQALQRTK